MNHSARISIASLVGAASLSVASPAWADSQNDWATASDITRDALVIAALGVPIAKGDTQGAIQAGGSMALTGGMTWVLKSTIHERRPDGSDDRSFPSGHTSISFAAAATLQNRYGWKVGVPAHAAAAFVGLARVEADKHYWHDVLAGAALGEITGLLLTHQRNESVQVFPWSEHKGGGVTIAARF